MLPLLSRGPLQAGFHAAAEVPACPVQLLADVVRGKPKLLGDFLARFTLPVGLVQDSLNSGTELPDAVLDAVGGFPPTGAAPRFWRRHGRFKWDQPTAPLESSPAQIPRDPKAVGLALLDRNNRPRVASLIYSQLPILPDVLDLMMNLVPDGQPHKHAMAFALRVIGGFGRIDPAVDCLFVRLHQALHAAPGGAPSQSPACVQEGR
jgi:hypothetical protein